MITALLPANIKVFAETTSGTCGDNLTWMLDDSGTLTISGTGDMENYNGYPNRSPFDHIGSIKNVIISNGVTSIGDYVFYYCDELTSITIPNSVTSIGSGAFSGCTGMTSITIPDSVTSIGNSAFYSCKSLVSIDVEPENAHYSSVDGILFDKNHTKLIQFPQNKNKNTYVIPNTVKSISSYAFYNCVTLTDVTIPDGVTSIGNYAFYGTALYKNSDNWEDNVLYIDKALISAKSTLSGEYVIKSGTRCIADYAFYCCRNATKITIPDSVVGIGNWAFYFCERLTSIIIPKNVSTIGKYILYRCDSLTSIDVNTNNTAYSSVGGVLFNKAKTELIQFPQAKTQSTYIVPDSVVRVNDYAFNECTNLTSVTMGNGVTYIGSHSFFDCTNLENVTIPNSVTRIEDCVFENCENLTAINVGTNNTEYCSADGVLFNKEKTELIQFPQAKVQSVYTIPDSVLCINDYAFNNCNSLTGITIPDSVTTIGNRAFYGCRNLVDVLIGNGVITIGDWAFCNCESIKSITIPDSVVTIGDDVFNCCMELSNIFFGKNLAEIGDDVFQCCESLSCSIYIPASLVSIGVNAFQCGSSKSPIQEFIVDEDNPVYGSWDGNLTNKDKTTLIQYAGTKNSSYKIPDGTKNIASSAFYFHYELKELTIPNSIETIEINAFCLYGDLENVYYNGSEEDWNRIAIRSGNDYLTDAPRTYFAYINIFDKNGNKVVEKTQNMDETLDISEIAIPENCILKLCKDKEMTEEYSLDTPISENLNLYYEIIELNKLKITGMESANIGQNGITERVTFATDKTATEFYTTVKYPEALNLAEIKSEDFTITTASYNENGYAYLMLTCIYNNGNIPTNTTLNAFDLVFNVSENAVANEILTVELIADDTFLANSTDGSTTDFESVGSVDIKINPIFVSGITINGADEIDKAMQYTAVISPENATNKEVEWSVDNSEIATISADGILTPVKAGTVKVTATAKDGSEVYGEKTVNVKVYAQITSLTASLGIWDKEFTSSEREYIIYVPKNTSSIKMTALHNGTLKAGVKTYYNDRAYTVSLSGEETVLTLAYSQTGYTDSEYIIKIVKFKGTKTTVTDNGTKFTVTPINIAGGNTVILALYNGDTFVEMQSEPYTGEDIPFATDKVYTNAKVMIWNSLESMTPICDVETVK